ncbi:MAG: hypothetical protein QNK37_12585 [Acidobacteriota bacterium]|nr:hypothetical protein [Acidobacteriota bacterium]
MKALIFKIVAVGVLGLGLWITAGGTACKDNYTQCTEGGCGTLDYAMECKMKCILADGSPRTITCSYPKPMK